MLNRFVALFLCFALVFPVSAVEYMTRDQTESAVVYDLPGVLPSDVYREQDPANMTANAFSRTADALSQNTKLTLGLVGGIGALGLAGVLSAPLAIIAAAAVGGVALVGSLTDNDRRQAARGYSYSNRGLLGRGTGSSTLLGATRDHRENGLLGSVFGITNDRGAYGVGALGISSSQRAPVHVNMQSPHVLNVMGRGYNFAGYDQNYHTGFSSQYSYMNGMGGVMNTMQHPYAYGQSQLMVQDGSFGYAYAPQSSFTEEDPTTERRGPASAGSSPSSPYMAAQPMNMMAQPGMMQQPGMTGAYPGMMPGGVNPMMAYGFAYAPREILHPSFEQTRERFNNFFERIQPAGALASSQGDPTGNYQAVPWYANVQYNWQASIGMPQNMLATSNQYEDGGLSWNQSSPQGRMTQTYALPVQQYDTQATSYPTGNAYNSQALPSGYQGVYAANGQSVQMGYGGTYTYPQYGLPAQTAPGQYATGSYAATSTINNSTTATNQTAATQEAQLQAQRQSLAAQLQQAVAQGNATLQKQLMSQLQALDEQLNNLK